MMILSSCSKTETLAVDPVFSDPNWIRIEIADGKEAHAVYGSIDDTLLVSTLYAIHQTTDNAKTWNLTKKDHQAIFGFLAKADTVFALYAHLPESQSNPALASYSGYFTLDNGSTWKNADQFKVSKQRSQAYGLVRPNSQVTLRIKENLAPINGSPNASIVLKSDVEIVKNGTSDLLDLPFNNQITNLYLDKKGRLYVSATCSIHDKISGKYLDYEKSQPAIVYISKRPILDMIN